MQINTKVGGGIKMLTLESLQELKEDLFTVVQYCHDNDKDFLENFNVDFDKVESLNAIYLAGSSSVILLTFWYHDELHDKTIPVVTQSLLEWASNHQNKCTQK